jgi:hypothetical protein
MSVAVIKTPNTDVNGHVSKWQAVHEPIEYLLERQDQQAQTRYKPSASTVRIQVIGAIPSGIEVGQRILWKSGNESKIYTITDINALGGIITTDGLDTATVLGGHVVYLDGYNNYFIETEVFYVGVNGYEVLGKYKNKTNLEGNVNLSIASILKTVCEYDNKFNYDTLNKAMIGEGGAYNIRFREIYNGIEQPLSNPFAAVQYFTNSSKQILDAYGSNMGEYVPTLDNTRPNKAKFLSVFDKPTIFKGFPFSMSFIYSDNLLNEEVEVEVFGNDVNGINVFNDTGILNHLERSEVNRLMMLDGLNDDIKTFELWLQTTGNTITTPPFDNGNVFEPGVFEPFQPVEPTPPNPTA